MSRSFKDDPEDESEAVRLLRQLSLDVSDIVGRQTEFEKRLKSVEGSGKNPTGEGDNNTGGGDGDGDGEASGGKKQGGVVLKKDVSSSRTRYSDTKSIPVSDEVAEDESETAEYASIRDLVAKVKLPNKLLLGDTSYTIAPESRRALNILKRSGGVIQTALRVLRDIDERRAAHADDVENIYVCLETLMKFLKKESNQLMYEGAGMDKSHIKLVNCMVKNEVSEQEVRAVEFATAIKKAALVSSEVKIAEDKSKKSKSQGNFGGNRKFDYTNRGYGPSGYNSGYRGSDQRGYNSQRSAPRDNFDSVVSQSTKM